MSVLCTSGDGEIVRTTERLYIATQPEVSAKGGVPAKTTSNLVVDSAIPYRSISEGLLTLTCMNDMRCEVVWEATVGPP